jgi:4-hydroxy 2-oxovalerate aldolase
MDACAICHPTRLKTLAVWPKGFEKTVITPRALSAEGALKGAGPVLDYGVETEAGVFKVRDNGCTIPSMLVAAYAIAACTAGGAGKIYLAGFDGYERGDPRQEEMASMISCYQAMSDARPLIALTPTLYPVHHSSVHSPNP